MIPDHLITKALNAWIGDHNCPHPDQIGMYRVLIARSLEAVAARIWDDGYIAAEWNYEEVCNCAAWNDSECACGNYGNGHRRKTNPYKETA